MAKKRDSERTDRRHLVAVALPVTVVLGVLILGAWLQSGPGPSGLLPQAPEAELPLPPPPAYEQRRLSDTALEEHRLEEEPVAESAERGPDPESAVERRVQSPGDEVDALARRVMRDVERLGSGGNGWTAQLGVYCDDAGVADMVGRFGDDPRFYVLPALLRDRACFRLCWGSYPDRARAERPSDLPAPFRGEGSIPRPISAVIE